MLRTTPSRAQTERMPGGDRSMLVMQYGTALTAVIAASLLTILR